jgi:phospholipid/cholesterol/gamma-HCH transport system substrate-binding protein
VTVIGSWGARATRRLLPWVLAALLAIAANPLDAVAQVDVPRGATLLRVVLPEDGTGGLEAGADVLVRLRDRGLPMLEDVARVSRAFAGIAERAERGEGLIGQILNDDRFAQTAQDATRDVAALVQGGLRLVERLEALAAQGERLLSESGGPTSSLPVLMRRVEQTLGNLERATRDVQRASARLPQTLRNVEDSTGALPSLLLQSQQATRELELLLAQLRGSWLLGGSGAPPAEPLRPASERLRP